MRKIKVLLLFLIPLTLTGQTGGRGIYTFLKLPIAARTAALGGNNISLKDGDINLIAQNAALLDSSMHNHLAVNYINYFADINYGFTSYAYHVPKLGTFAAGMQFVNYGTFTAADATGEITGTFGAGDYSFNLSYARKIDSTFNVGGTLKTIYSKYESYTSVGNAIDLGAIYKSKDKLLSLAAVIKNVGFQWSTYRPGDREQLPFEIQLGITKKLEKAPIRFSITGQHLQRWDLTYEDPANPTLTVDPLTGEDIKQSKAKEFGDKLMRHVVVGGELLLTKNFHIRAGYNYLRRQELKVDTRPGMIGFSFGFGLKISKFHLSYGRAAYHLGGASNHFSLTTNLSEFNR